MRDVRQLLISVLIAMLAVGATLGGLTGTTCPNTRRGSATPTVSGRPLEATARPPPYLIAAESSARGAGHVPRLLCCGAVNTAQPKTGAAIAGPGCVMIPN